VHCRARASEHEFNPSRQASFTGTCPHWVRSGLSSQYQFYVSSIADNLAVLRLLVGDSRSGKKRAERGTTAGVPQVQKFNPDSWWLAGCKGQAYDCWFQTSAKVVEGPHPSMSDAKQPSKRRRRSKTLPVLGAAGLSLSLASTASAVPGGPAVDLANPGNVGAGALVGWSGATDDPPALVGGLG